MRKNTVKPGEMLAVEFLLFWPLYVSEMLKELFNNNVFRDMYDLKSHAYKRMPSIDQFYIIIHWSGLETVIDKSSQDFKRKTRIYVIRDDFCSLSELQFENQVDFQSIKFFDLESDTKLFEQIITDGQLEISNELKQEFEDSIKTLAEQHRRFINLKLFFYRSRMQRRCLFTNVYSFPASHLNSEHLSPWFCCSSCKLMCTVSHSLECEHKLCLICLHTKTKCVQCQQAIRFDKNSVNQILQSQSQNLSLPCLYCSSKALMPNFKEHFVKHHNTKFSHMITTATCETENSSSFIVSSNGSCIWQIPNVQRLRDSTGPTAERKSIYSCPFYLYPNGYKMCLCLFINGDGKGNKNHCMSLFFALLRGDYDNDLQWPFQHAATFTLVNQSNPNDVRSSNQKICRPDPNLRKLCFEKPIIQMNNLFGISSFIPFDLINESPNDYIRNNTMYIKFQVNFLSQMPGLSSGNDIGEMPENVERIGEPNDDIDRLIFCHFRNQTASK